MDAEVPVRLAQILSTSLATRATLTCLLFPLILGSAAGSTAPDHPVKFEDFVGADTCGDCHAEQYKIWQKSTHGRAGAPPSPESVISDFDGTVLYFSDATVELQQDGGERFLYHVDRPGKARQTFEVAGFVGGGHMMGGGTQASFSRYSDGSWRLLPFDYSRHSDLWFCDSKANGSWLPITPQLSLDSCKYWPPVNNFSPNCGNCHSSQMQSSFDLKSQQDQLRFMDLAINCESCHGPGRRHVDLMRMDDHGDRADIGMEPLELLDKQASVEVCFRCHALTEKLSLGYLPGKPLQDFYALNNFSPDGRHGDGRENGFAYQEGHLYSDCFLSGSMTCVDCHDPHSQQYRDTDGFGLPGKLDDGQCIDCHPAKAANIEGHTGHTAQSSGSRCTACHMPFLQHKIIGKQVKFARSDHTIPIPRPELDASLGLETACAACHPGKPVSWQQQHIDSWHGTIKPHKPIIATVLALQQSKDPQLAKRTLDQDFSPHPSAELDLLRLVGDILDLPGPALSPRMRERLRELEKNSGLDASSLARAWLIASTADPTPVEEMTAASGRRTALWLMLQGSRELNRGQTEAAIDLLEKSRDLDPQNLHTYLLLTQAYQQAGQFGKSLSNLRSAAAVNFHSRDEYLNFVNHLCAALDGLGLTGKQAKPAIERLCAEESRLPAIPVSSIAPERKHP